MKDLFGEEIHPDRDPAFTAGRRKTRLQNRRPGLIKNHPQNTNPAGPKGKTCGDCRLCYGKKNYTQTTFYKCGFVEMTHSGMTDIRLKWEACERFEELWHLFDQFWKENEKYLENWIFTPIYKGFTIKNYYLKKSATFQGDENEAIAALRGLIAKIKARKENKHRRR